MGDGVKIGISTFNNNLNRRVDDRIGDDHHLKVRMFTHLFENLKANRENDINRDTARRNNGGNKLRLYRNIILMPVLRV